MYDIFISYTGAERPFAQLLDRDLKRRTYHVFFDRANLRAGESWDNQLTNAIEDSRHLVFFWADRTAQEAQWVVQEAAVFEAHQRKFNLEGRIIPLYLNGDFRPHGSVQGIRDLADEAKVYETGATAQKAVDNLDPLRWNRVLQELDYALEIDKDWITVLTSFSRLPKPKSPESC
jgi:TIR domain